MSNRFPLIPLRSGRFASASLLLLVSAVLLALGFISCTAQPEVRQVEVTREVEVVREIPVTVEHTETVDVTREVPVTREIPVTVQVVKTVETPITREIEVTREVPVTRIITATPVPTETAPSPTPVPAPTPTPLPPKSRFVNWELEHDFHAGRQVSAFRNVATAHEPLPNAPVATFLCDNRGYRSMYIDWLHPVVGVIDTSISPYTRDPFDVYRQVDANVFLADYARRLHAFVTGVRLNPQDSVRFRELWRETKRDYDLSELTSPEDLIDFDEPLDMEEQADGETDDEVEVAANRGSALIQLDFAVEIPRLMRENWYRPSVRATIRSDWRVLSNQRTLMGDGAIGSIHQSYETIAPSRSEQNNLRIMTADIGEPDQPVALFAKWEITGLGEVLDHCREIRN